MARPGVPALLRQPVRAHGGPRQRLRRLPLRRRGRRGGGGARRAPGGGALRGAALHHGHGGRGEGAHLARHGGAVAPIYVPYILYLNSII